MKNLLRILGAVICILMLIGCQKNPSSDVVVNKLESDVYSVQTNENEVRYDAPATWSEQVENGAVTYQIQADIQVPAVTAYPIIEVTPTYFDFDSLDAIIMNLLPNAEIKIEDISIVTKQDVQQEIDMILASINNVDENHPELSEDEKEAYLQARQADLEAAKEKYRQAPAELPSVEITSIKEMQNQTPYIQTAAVYDQEEQKQCIFSLRDSHVDLRFATFFLYMTEAYDPNTKTFTEFTSMSSPRTELDDERVEKAANAFLSQIGLSEIYYLNFIINGMWFADGEIAIFTKNYAGIPATYAFSNNSMQETENAVIWSPESIMVYIDAGYHVRRMDWLYPSDIVGTINENVALLPFDQVQQLIRKNLSYCQPDLPYWDNITHRTIVIDRIVLGMMRVSKIKAPDQYTMIPVWDCFGYFIDHYESQDKSEYVLNENNDAVIDENGGIGSFLTINAIDGSVIDRNLGY